MLNMSMARGMGLPHLPHPHGGHPLAGHPGVNGAPHLPTHHALTSSAGAVIGRPTSTPSTGSTNNAFNGKSWTHWRISGNRRPPKTRKQEWPPFEANTHARRATIYLLLLLLYVVVVVQFLGIQAACFFSIGGHNVDINVSAGSKSQVEDRQKIVHFLPA